MVSASPPSPDRWLVLEVPRPGDPDREAMLVERLMELQGRGVEEREDAFLVYLPPPEEDLPGAVEAVLRDLHLAGDLEPGTVRHRWQDHQEWAEAWRRGLAPRRITPRLVVSPTWEDPSLEPGDVLISLDPGMAFGTAEHPTTRGCLRLLDRRVEPGRRIADVGAGSGILSIAAALLGAEDVVAVEMEPWSCSVIRENAAVNRVADRIRIVERTVGPDFLPEEGPFEGILANIERGVLTPLLPGFRGGLDEGGWLVASGILDHEAEGFVRAARDAGFTLLEEDREDGWWTGALGA